LRTAPVASAVPTSDTCRTLGMADTLGGGARAA